MLLLSLCKRKRSESGGATAGSELSTPNNSLSDHLMSIVGEDSEIILNASLANSPESADTIEDSSQAFLEKIKAFGKEKNEFTDVINRYFQFQ